MGSANILSSLSPLKRKEKQSSSGGDCLGNSKHPSGDGQNMLNDDVNDLNQIENPAEMEMLEAHEDDI